MVLILAAIEDDFFDAFFNRPLGDGFADPGRRIAVALVGTRAAQVLLGGAG